MTERTAPGVRGERPAVAGPGVSPEEVAAATAVVLVLRGRSAASLPAGPARGGVSEWVRSGRLAARRTWARRGDWRWAGRLPGRPRT